jgi:integrase
LNEIVPVQNIGPLDQHPAAVYIAGLPSVGSRRKIREALNEIARILGAQPLTRAVERSNGKIRAEDWTCLAIPWHELRYQHTAAIRAQLMARYSAATTNRILSALRGTLKEAWRLGLMPAEAYQAAVDLKPIPGETVPAGRSLTAGEIAALLGACEADPGPAGARDAAMIALTYGAGLRREEVARLDLADYDAGAGRLLIHGKRNKQRTSYLENGAAAALADWLDVRGQQPGPLFWPINKGGKLTPARMSDQSVYKILAKRGAEAGIERFSPHDLRRTLISDMLEAGADISTVANVVGHASTDTTRRYDRRGERAKQKAAGLIHIPYKRRKAQT